MRVLVTGGAGYIGSHTLLELLSDGHEVFVIDNFINASPVALKQVANLANQTFPSAMANVGDTVVLNEIF